MSLVSRPAPRISLGGATGYSDTFYNNREDLDIQITGDLLNIRGEVKQEIEEKDAKYHLREHRYQSFSRSLTLPAAVVADKANAAMKNGILTLTLPKAEEAKPKVISVKAK